MATGNRTVTRAALAAAIVIVAGLAATAQVSFDVVSIKPHDMAQRVDSFIMSSISPGGDRWRAGPVNAESLIIQAFSEPGRQWRRSQIVGGPDWLRSAFFDLEATIAGDAPRDVAVKALPSLIRAVLDDRFQFKGHTERRELAVYALVLAHSDGRLGPGMHPSDIDCAAVAKAQASMSPAERQAAMQDALKEGAPPCGIRTGVNGLAAGAVTIQGLAPILEGPMAGLDRPVIDHTGLTGRYDIDLKWERGPITVGPTGAISPAAPDAPSLFTVLPEQLGLKLEPRRELLDVIVVEHIEHPTPN